MNLPRSRLHLYAAFSSAASFRFLASNSSGLRFPSAECMRTLLKKHSMCSNISSVDRSLASRVRACAHLAFMRPMSDSVAALPHGDDMNPIEGSMPAPRMVPPRSGETYRLPSSGATWTVPRSCGTICP